MPHFKKITLADREWIFPLLAQSDFRAAEYSFANAYNWSAVFNIEVASTHGFLLIRTGEDTKNYLFPAGSGDLKALVQELLNEARAAAQPLVIRDMPIEKKNELEQLFPGVFEFSSNRNNFDYIYLSDDLINLTGKKFQSKRNLVSRFKKTFPTWQYEDITADNLPECVAMNDKWCRLYGCNDNRSLHMETCAVCRALQNFFDEQLLGGLLRVDGEIAAYTVGERLNSDTLIIHIEKAFSETYPGAYQTINREFVTRHAAGLQYVNREDDAGDEGLRKAKLSYQPVFLLEKYTAKQISN